ncbi:vancomycin resistance protein [Saccharomonospora piscinae]|uniref:VanW family protein n=1 Tax=Saccharomonospora piscinae TaxID=687388 RepID=UPI001105CD63|nr:VanW family protein [Saccharomonospora piscinae]TLW93278.1 vancomycin resistance protein [Saccharomonospora piscinae]
MGGSDNVDDTAERRFAEELLRPGAPRSTQDTLPAVPQDRRTQRTKRRVGNLLLVLGALTALLTVAYVVDLFTSIGDVPRGVTVSGVDIGGLDAAEAERVLRRELGPRVSRPLELRAGEVVTPLDPTTAGLHIDWAATVEHAGGQPWKPWARLGALFGRREVEPVPVIDGYALRTAVREVAQRHVNRPAVEGGIGLRPVESGESGDAGAVEAHLIEPRAGARVSDVEAAVSAIVARWPQPGRVEIPVEVLRPRLTAQAVHSTLDSTVRPLLAGPVLLRGDGRDAVLLPDDLGRAMEFHIVGDAERPEGARLDVTLNHAVLRTAASTELLRTRRPARDADLVFRGGVPVVVPSVRGTTIAWERTFAGFTEAVVTAPEGRREVPVRYDPVEPSVTTDEVRALGVREVVATATTLGHSPDVLSNLRGMAAAVHGTVVRPGETFRLDRHTGPRTASRGYGRAPLYEDGTGPRVLGGGVSQLTSTLYAAVYSAGLPVVERTPHQRYLGRYPPGLDAVSAGVNGSPAEFAFTNDTATALAVRAAVTASEVTVTLWGTRSYDVDIDTRCERDGDSAAVTTTRVRHPRHGGGAPRTDTTTTTYALAEATPC